MATASPVSAFGSYPFQMPTNLLNEDSEEAARWVRDRLQATRRRR